MTGEPPETPPPADSAPGQGGDFDDAGDAGAGSPWESLGVRQPSFSSWAQTLAAQRAAAAEAEDAAGVQDAGRAGTGPGAGRRRRGRAAVLLGAAAVVLVVGAVGAAGALRHGAGHAGSIAAGMSAGGAPPLAPGSGAPAGGVPAGKGAAPGTQPNGPAAAGAGNAQPSSAAPGSGASHAASPGAGGSGGQGSGDSAAPAGILSVSAAQCPATSGLLDRTYTCTFTITAEKGPVSWAITVPASGQSDYTVTLSSVSGSLDAGRTVTITATVAQNGLLGSSQKPYVIVNPGGAQVTFGVPVL